ncbi:MAG: hypothetical protein WKG01_23525 [Kofleriaceae bacterium]
MKRLLTPLAMVLLCLPATVLAAPKIALTAIEGDANGSMRDAVAAALDGDELSVIGKREVNRATDSIDIEELSEKDAKRLGKELEADAILQAKLGKEGANKTLKFKLFVKGEKARGFTVKFVSAKTTKFKRMLKEKVVARLDEGGKGDEDQDESRGKGKKGKDDEVSDKDDKDKDADEDDDEGSSKRRKKVASADEDEEDGISSSVKIRPSNQHTANRVAIRLDAGMSFANRSYRFNTQDFEGAPRGFTSSPVPGARFEVEMYPIAFLSPKSFAAGLGFAADYDKTLKLNLTSTGDDAGKNFPTKQQSYSFGGRFRIAFGKSATSPTTTLGFSYGRRTFKVDASGAMNPNTFFDVPDTDYKFLAPSLAFRIPFASSFAFIAEGNGMLIRNAGQIQDKTHYGQAKVLGFGGNAGFDITFGNRFGLRLVGELTQVGYSFTGTGEKTNNLDDDPEKDVGGMADRSIGGSATLGVLY